MKNPCRKCLVSSMCKQPCDEYDEYVYESLKDYPIKMNKSTVSHYFRHSKPRRLSLELQDGKSYCKIVLDESTIINIETYPKIKTRSYIRWKEK